MLPLYNWQLILSAKLNLKFELNKFLRHFLSFLTFDYSYPTLHFFLHYLTFLIYTRPTFLHSIPLHSLISVKVEM